MDYLKVEELKPYYLYKIKARNGQVGIWRPDKGEFTLRRTKFGDVYTFGEIHWDLDKHFGTVKPTEELEKSPFSAADFEYKDMTWEELGIEKPEWAWEDTVSIRLREKEMLNYLKGWEDKIDTPHPREPYNGKK